MGDKTVATRRSPTQMAEENAWIYDMHLSGRTLRLISLDFEQKFGRKISHEQVRRRMQKECDARVSPLVEQARQAHTDRIQNQIMRITARMLKDPDNEDLERILMAAHDQLAKVQGTYAPSQIETKTVKEASIEDEIERLAGKLGLNDVKPAPEQTSVDA